MVFLLILGLLAAPASAQDLKDFSNDLASDLGPLLTLFGERITIQFLSECLSSVDCLIFALGPIGLITAVVSLIRVRGSPSLRAVIGRAQEAEAIAEAELCTSTSEDVCEVFSKGGITRAFGRSDILEIVRLPNPAPGTDSTQVDDARWASESMGIFLLRDYLASLLEQDEWKKKETTNTSGHRSYSDIGWRRSLRRIFNLRRFDLPKCDGEVEPEPSPRSEEEGKAISSAVNVADETTSIRSRLSNAQTPRTTGAPLGRTKVNPNLSLNVGITRRGKLASLLIVCTGIIIQLGIFAMAGVIGWEYQWTTEGAPENKVNLREAVARNKAPITYIVGTVAMSIGMFLAAYMIGEHTREVSFRRQPATAENGSLRLQSRLYWLQPGPQVIGDQTFGPYATCERKEKPLMEYVISTKLGHDDHRHTEIKVAAVVIVCLAGYVVQFVGLRGMNGSVSVAHLASVLLMSCLRGWYRIQRLPWDANKVEHVRHDVEGRELDWLALQLLKDEVEAKAAGGSASSNRDVGSTSLNRQVGRGARFFVVSCESERLDYWDSWNDGPYTATHHPVLGDPIGDLLAIRTRLAYLSGHPRGHNMPTLAHVHWDSTRVPARSRALQLATSISLLGNTLGILPDSESFSKRGIRIWVAMSDETHIEDVINSRVSISISPPDAVLNPHEWTLDSARLEAVLGLHIWSLYSHRQPKKNKSRSSTVSSAPVVQSARFLSSFPAGNLPLRQGLLDLLSGGSMQPVELCRIDCVDLPLFNSTTAWRYRGLRPRTQYTWVHQFAAASSEVQGGDDYEKDDDDAMLTRFFGWDDIKTEGNTRGVDLYYSNSKGSDLDEMSFDMFNKLVRVMLAGRGRPDKEEYLMKPDSSFANWNNETISHIFNAFTRSGLGDQSDAVRCILPCLADWIKIDAEDSLAAAIRVSISYPTLGQWAEAERILLWALDEHITHARTPHGHMTRAQDWDDHVRWLGNEWDGPGVDFEHYSEPSAPGGVECILIALAEIYRRALSSKDERRRRFGYDGISWIVSQEKSFGKNQWCQFTPFFPGLNNLIHRYHAIACHVAQRLGEQTVFPGIPGLARPEDVGLDAIAEGDFLEIPAEELLQDQGGDGDENYPPNRIRALECLRAQLLARMCYDGHQKQCDEYSMHKIWSLARRQQWLCVSLASIGGSLSSETALYSLELDSVPLVRSFRHEIGSLTDSHLIDSAALTVSIQALRALRGIGRCVRYTHTVKSTPLVLLLDARYKRPLHEVIEMAGLLLEIDGVSMNGTPGEEWSSPITYAASRGSEAMVEFLLGQGADPNDVSEAMTPLTAAVRRGEAGCVRVLLRYPRVFHELRDYRGRTPLLEAVVEGHLEVVEVFLGDGTVDQDASDDEGRTALMIAAGLESGGVLSAILEAGADLERQDHSGNTALQFGARISEECTRILVEHGADANARNEKGETPLHAAAEGQLHGFAETGLAGAVSVLLGAGADPWAMDGEGRKAVDKARGEEVVRLLREAMDGDIFGNGDISDGGDSGVGGDDVGLEEL